MTIQDATWTAVAALLEDLGGRQSGRAGTTRYWRVPSPTGGTFLVEVTLRRRWCSVSVDRWRTTDRVQEPAEAWFREHIWPLVEQGCRGRNCVGFAPTGGGTFASAHPVDRSALLRVLGSWVEQELTWGEPRGADCGWIRED